MKSKQKLAMKRKISMSKSVGQRVDATMLKGDCKLNVSHIEDTYVFLVWGTKTSEEELT